MPVITIVGKNPILVCYKKRYADCNPKTEQNRDFHFTNVKLIFHIGINSPEFIDHNEKKKVNQQIHEL